VRVAGIALERLAGRTVELSAGDRTLGTATVAADGTFAATLPAPPAGRRARIRYVAAVGAARSAGFRLERRLVITRRTRVSRGVRMSGRIATRGRRRPLLRISRQLTCGTREPFARVRPRRDGRFTVTLPAHAGAVTIYRAAATVGRNRTFTLPIAVPAA
jgi:hypothetical protein